jgi:CRP/FNR family transcriptional regulator, cyclic AMP receptor protein
MGYGSAVPAPYRRAMQIGRHGRGLDSSAIVDALGSTPMFRVVPRETLHRMAMACTTRTFGRGQYLWYQGDDGDRLLIVVSGALRIVVQSERGDEVVLVTLGPGETTGELALLDGAPRSASVVAAEPTTVLMLARTAVLELLAENPHVLDAVLRNLGQMVRRLTDQVADLIFLDLTGRLAKLLLRLGQGHARPDGTVVIDLGMTQSDLAAMVGASRPAVNKVLQRMVVRGLITVDGQVIVLHDLDGLRGRADY